MTLNFSWATNANYSTGPDAGTPTKVDPSSTANGFINGTIAAAQHINFLYSDVGAEMAKAIDGDGGGTYSPSADIVISGSEEWHFGLTTRVLAGEQLILDGTSELVATSTSDITMQSGSAMLVAAGATLGVTGFLTINSAGQLIMAGNMSVPSGGDIEIDGGTFQVTGGSNVVIDDGSLLFIADANDLSIANDTRTTRFNMTPAFNEPDAGGAPSWQMSNGVGTWTQQDVATQRLLVFPVMVVPGDEITTLSVAIEGLSGGHVTIPGVGDRVEISLVAVDVTGASTTLASLEDQSANAAAYDTYHLLTLSNGATGMTGTMPQTVASGSVYYLVVQGEQGANAVAGALSIRAVLGSGVTRSFLGTGTVTHYP